MANICDIDAVVEVTESSPIEILEVTDSQSIQILEVVQSSNVQTIEVNPQPLIEILEIGDSRIEILEVVERGLPGESAYEIAVRNGYIGSEAEWLLTLKAEEGAIDAFYIHNQISSQSIWFIEHNLNKFPSVTIVDSAGTVVYGEIEYIDTDTLQIIFSSAFGGKAYLN